MEQQHLDHREFGSELDLFASHPLVGPGLPLWLPAGAVIRSELEKLAAEEALRSGAQRVYSPVLAKRELYELSGHWQKFSEDMFPVLKVGQQELVLRPANCPHHAMIYASRPHSWRDLPVRYAELGAMFRSELSGVLSGLSRVRQINLDDCHVFCTPDQAHHELVRAVQAIQRGYQILGLQVDYYRLSARGQESLGDPALWNQAEALLENVLKELDLPHRRVEGEAAFYGPKIDAQFIDSAGKEETISTVQFDFVQPERFGLKYIAEDGAARQPLMIHRGLFGSMERMFSLLLEKYQAQLPPWLAPIQLAVLPIGEAQLDAAESAAESLSGQGVRVDLELEGSLGSRIRKARNNRVPWIAVIGAREAESGTVNLSLPKLGVDREIAVHELLLAISKNLAERSSSPSL